MATLRQSTLNKNKLFKTTLTQNTVNKHKFIYDNIETKLTK